MKKRQSVIAFLFGSALFAVTASLLCNFNLKKYYRPGDYVPEEDAYFVKEVDDPVGRIKASKYVVPSDNKYNDQKTRSLGTSLIGDIESVWSNYTGAGTKIAIIDDGFDYDHPEFTRSNNQSAILDASGYYYVDKDDNLQFKKYSDNHANIAEDWEYVGKDNNNKSVYEWATHGTATSTTAAAPMGNGGGVGIAPQADILALKIDFSFAAIEAAIDYAISQDVDVINMSLGAYEDSFTDGWGESHSYNSGVSGYLEDACRRAYNAGIIVVAAAGNESTWHKSYPACNYKVVGVGATGEWYAKGDATRLAEFSNYVKSSQTGEINVDIVAPGYVYTAEQTVSSSSHTSQSSAPSTHSHSYADTQGTSFSSPIVAGAACLWKQKYPNGTPDQFLSQLQSTADRIGYYADKNVPVSNWDEELSDVGPSNIQNGTLNVNKLLNDDPFVTTVQSNFDISVGEKRQITLDTYNGNITYSSSSPSVAIVSDAGLIEGKSAGSATITVTASKNNKTATADISVQVNAAVATTSMNFNPNSVTLSVGETYDSESTIITSPSNASRVFLFESLDPSVVTVNEDTGVATAVSEGTAEIYATAIYGDGDATLTVNVSEPTSWDKITSTSDLTNGDYLIVYGAGNKAFNGGLDSLDSTNNNISVSISNDSIEYSSATEAAKFTINSVTGGYSIKSASGYYIGRDANSNGMDTSTSNVYVNTISFDSSGNVTIAGAGGKIMCFNTDQNQSRFRYMNSGGSIQLYKGGSGGGSTPTPTPTVSGVTVSPSSLNLDLSGTSSGTLTAIVNGTNSPAQTVTWDVTSANPSGCVSVSNSGVVTANAVGTATVTATSTVDTTKSGACTVTVTNSGSGGGGSESGDISSTPLTSSEITNGMTVVWGTESGNFLSSVSSNWGYLSTDSDDWMTFTLVGNSSGFTLKNGSDKYIYSSAEKKLSLESSYSTTLSLDANNDYRVKSSDWVYVYNDNNGSGGIRPYKSIGSFLPTYLYAVSSSSGGGDTPTPTPTPTVSSVTVSPSSLELDLNGTTSGALTATVNGSNEPSQEVTWDVESANPSGCVSVSNSGVVTANAVGTATVTATSVADSTKQGECTVTVTDSGSSGGSGTTTATYTIGWGAASGAAGTYSNFTDITGSVTDLLSFECNQNSATNPPAYNSNSSELRLYYNSQGNGCYIDIFPVEGITFTGFTITATSGYTPTCKYSVDGGSLTTASLSNTTYSASDISASSSLRIQNANTSNAQFRIKTISLTYEVPDTSDKIVSSLTASYTGGNVYVGDSLNESAVSVTAHYTDSSKYPDAVLNSSDYSLTGFSSSTSGEKTVTVTYTGSLETLSPTITTTFKVNVIEDSVTDVTVTNTRTYHPGETISKGDITVTLAWASGKASTTTTDFTFANDGYRFTYADAASGGGNTQKQFSITYAGQNYNFNVNVSRVAYSEPSTTASGLFGADFGVTGGIDVGTSSVIKDYDSITINGINYTATQIYVFNYNSDTKYLSFGKNIGQIHNTTPFSAPIASIGSFARPSNNPRTDEVVYVSVDGNTWVLASAADFVNNDYYYIKVATITTSSSYSNFNLNFTLKGQNNAANVSNYIMYTDTTNQCTTKLDIAVNKLNNMSNAEKNTFWTSEDYVIATARERLLAWATHENKTIDYSNNSFIINSNRNVIQIVGISEGGTSAMAIIIVSALVGLTTVGGYFFLKRKKEY